MSTIITVKNISKTYKISHEQMPKYNSLRDDIMSFFANPFKTEEKTELFWALKDVSFNIQKGETVGIIGSNGAGKSTLLKILSRITPPTHGEVQLRGRVASLLEVGTGFHPELTGRENIFLSGAILGMHRREIIDKFDQIVSFAEVSKFLDTPIKHYSSGMYVRLAFAVAAHLEPEILLVDEILAVGDMRFQEKSLGKMKGLGKSGKTILFVSHNLAAIRSFCSRAILFQHGKIIADGSVSEVIEKYTHEVSKNILSRTWNNPKNAPKNASCIINDVTITNTEGKLLEQVSIDDAIEIHIRYKTLRNNAFVGFSLRFFDNENKCILQTISNHEKNWYAKPMPNSEFVSTCQIPANLFNNGAITIKLQIFDANFSDPFTTDDILSLDFIDGINTRGDYYGTFEGTVRPLFPWETKIINK